MKLVVGMAGLGTRFQSETDRFITVDGDNRIREEFLNQEIIDEALTYGEVTRVSWYEKPWLKKTRQMYSGEWSKAFFSKSPKQQLKEVGIKPISITDIMSHVAAGISDKSV